MNALLPPPRLPSCPSDLELEALRRPSVSSRWAEHVAGCASCGERGAWMDAAAADFAAQVLPATLASVQAQVQEGAEPMLPLAEPIFGGSRRAGPAAKPSLWRWSPGGTPLRWGLVPVAFAVGMALLLLRPVGPPPGYVGIKGGGPPAALQVFLGENGHGRALAPGEEVHAGDGLRFSVDAPGERVFVLTVDARGQVSWLYPTNGADAVPAAGVLPGGAVLDDVTGPERIFVVYARDGVGLSEIDEAARAAADGGPQALRELSRLPVDAPQESFLLEKVPR
jgi:hypothetical protein